MSWLVKALLGAVTGPVFGSILDGYRAKLAAGADHDRLAADLAARELAVEQAEVRARAALRTAEIGHPWEPEKLFAYVVLVYFAKLLLWDKVLALGTTDPLTGDASAWAGTVMAFLFLKRGAENVARIWRG